MAYQKKNWFSNKNSLNWIQRTINNLGNGLGSALAKFTGSELTGAEQEANAFNAEQAQLAREHDIYMSENKYQMETQSMQEAGLNPAMLYGGGNLVQTHATGAAADSVSPSNSNIADLAQMFMSIARLPSELKNLKSQYDLNMAEKEDKLASAHEKESAAAEHEATAANLNEQTRFLIETFDERVHSSRLQNKEYEANIDLIRQKKSESIEQMNLFIKQQATEDEKAFAEKAKGILSYMETYEIWTMMPFKQAQMTAETNRANAEAANAWNLAKLNGINYLVQKKLFDSDYYDNIIKTEEYRAMSAEQRAKIDKVIADMRTGKVLKDIDLGDSDVANFFDSILNTYGTQPINGMVKIFSNLMQFMPFVNAGVGDIASAASYRPII